MYLTHMGTALSVLVFCEVCRRGEPLGLNRAHMGKVGVILYMSYCMTEERSYRQGNPSAKIELGKHSG